MNMLKYNIFKNNIKPPPKKIAFFLGKLHWKLYRARILSVHLY
jgi:hypothetical protein